MSKYSSGVFKPKFPKKYVGKIAPRYRSSWERSVFQFLDENTNVISWASEPIRIPYVNPFTGKNTNYIPDLLIKYIDRRGKEHVELIEIKPSTQTFQESAKSKYDKASVILNHAKWKQASNWCKQYDITFRILTESDIFGMRL